VGIYLPASPFAAIIGGTSRDLGREESVVIRAASKDALTLAELALQLWPDHTLSELEAEFSELVAGEDGACFLSYVEGRPIGFAQCQLRRDYVEGTETSPVGYLEGIFVREPFRHQGFGRELLQACETWARDKKCSEFASDCELDNTDSLKFHLAMGFEEMNRIICFKKRI